MPQGRQLAAIMFTDIVGYTAMMPALRKAFDKPELKKLFELRRKNIGVQNNKVQWKYNSSS